MNELNNLLIAPHAGLRKMCRPVEKDEFGPELDDYMRKISEIMRNLGGVGLAAPQVEDARRLFVMNPEDGETGLLKIVNPEILESSDDTIEAEERCLSLPDFVTDVNRHYSIKIKYYDALGEVHTGSFSGLNAVIIQHEIDHLNGKTMLDHAGRVSRTMYIKKIKKQMMKAKKAANILQSL